jgi:hypothetical protein
LAEQYLEIYEAISQIYMLCNTLHEYKTVKSYHVLNAELNAINILFFFLIIAKKMHAGLALTQKQLWDSYNMKEARVVS